jgi:hypothetical protein
VTRSDKPAHDECEPAELEEVSRDEEKRVEDLLFLASAGARREEDDEKGDDAQHCYPEIDQVESGRVELL